MPVHDWTRVEAGIFRHFHTTWIAGLGTALNGGILPEGFYALVEQHAGRSIPDILTLQSAQRDRGLPPDSASPGGTALAEVPPRARHQHTVKDSLPARRRSLAVRHVSGHPLIALIEILSPSNKDRPRSVTDPQGMHGEILNALEGSTYDLPCAEPLTLAAYVADGRVDIYVEHLAIGNLLVDMPLFLSPERYVNAPLEPTYQAAYGGMAEFWRNVLEGKTPGS